MTFYSPADLASRWSCGPNFVLKLIKSGALPAVSIGKMWRVRPEDAEAFEATSGSTPSKEPCDVYVIRCAAYVKIGKAADTAKRILSLQMANPYDIETVAVLTEGDGHRLERDLHQRFAPHRHKGEWSREEGELALWIASGCQIAKCS